MNFFPSYRIEYFILVIKSIALDIFCHTQLYVYQSVFLGIREGFDSVMILLSKLLLNAQIENCET